MQNVAGVCLCHFACRLLHGGLCAIAQDNLQIIFAGRVLSTSLPVCYASVVVGVSSAAADCPSRLHTGRSVRDANSAFADGGQSRHRLHRACLSRLDVENRCLFTCTNSMRCCFLLDVRPQQL